MNEFTKALYELFVIEGIPLSMSLLIMKKKPKVNAVSKTAEFLYGALENGSLFSNALKSCTVIHFDDAYISFVSVAEKNGDLKTALVYLKQKLEREADCKKKIRGAFIYPTFVIFLSVFASVFISIYTKTEDFALLIKYVSVLILVCIVLYFLIIRLLGENKLFEAFTAVDFLLKNGIELSEAVGCAVQIAGPSSKTGRIFENARIKLSYGMDLQNAFCVRNNAELKEAFYYADAGAGKDDLFARIAAYLKSEKEKKRTVCLSLIEPLFIVVTGAFLLLLLMTFFMPLINNITLI